MPYYHLWYKAGESKSICFLPSFPVLCKLFHLFQFYTCFPLYLSLHLYRLPLVFFLIGLTSYILFVNLFPWTGFLWLNHLICYSSVILVTGFTFNLAQHTTFQILSILISMPILFLWFLMVPMTDPHANIRTAMFL